MSRLTDLGWGISRSSDDLPPLPDNHRLARVLEEQRGRFTVALEGGDVHAQVAGRLRHASDDPTQRPCVGDYVVVEAPIGGGPTVIQHVLPRTSLLERKAAGRSHDRQPIAANVDCVWIATAADDDLSVRRLERYLALVYEAGAEPLVLLTKLDVAADPEVPLAKARSVSVGAPIVSVSAHSGEGIAELRSLLVPRQTIVVVGSSGVGKSTLVNLLLGEEAQTVRAIRERDQKGVHTTTSRRLLVLPEGTLLIDTPGMRELAAASDEGLQEAFADVEGLARSCRYGDCTHKTEPGCAVQEAVESGTLDAERLTGYGKLLRESAHLARKTDAHARMSENRRWKQIAKQNRARTKNSKKR